MSTPALVALVVAVAVLGIGGWWLRRRSAAEAQGRPEDALDTVAAWPPEVSRVLTTPEQRAYQLLVRNLPSGYAILAQVPLSRFLRVPTRHSYREWMRRVGRLNADLLVCDSTFQVLAVVNVRPAHGSDSQRGIERHERMDRVLRKAGVRVLNWRQDALPDAAVVAELVLGRAELAQREQASLAARQAPSAHAAAPEGMAEAATAAEEFAAAEPLPSTFFDDLESRPVPLPRPKPRE